MEVLAIIPARAGSKGLPGKNLKDLGGYPLIAWTIQAVKKSRYVTDSCFTTEDEEIARVAKRFGANVPFLRPKELAEDSTSSLAVLLHALLEMERLKEKRYDIVVYLQPTSPFRDSEVIDRAIEILLNDDRLTSVVGVKSAGDSHPFWDLKERDGILYYYIEDLPFPRPMRRQDLPPAYHFNGAIAVSRRDYYVQAKDPMPTFGQPFGPVVMDSIQSVNIDREEDLLLARALLQVYPEIRERFW